MSQISLSSENAINFNIMSTFQHLPTIFFSNIFQGSPQWVQVDFEKPVNIRELEIQFQGGFVGKTCWIEGSKTQDEQPDKLCDFFPEDKNPVQVSFCK